MKKFSILALTLMLAFSFAACNKEAVKQEAASKTMEKAVEKKAEVAKVDPKVAACKADADKAFDACVKKAAKDAKKLAACDTNKTKAYAACDKPAAPVKKAAPAKK
jgi:curli biogenesis system outer membrane secretion channel CsgG